MFQDDKDTSVAKTQSLPAFAWIFLAFALGVGLVLGVVIVAGLMGTRTMFPVNYVQAVYTPFAKWLGYSVLTLNLQNNYARLGSLLILLPIVGSVLTLLPVWAISRTRNGASRNKPDSE